MDLSIRRKLAAGAALTATATLTGWEAVRHFSTEWVVLAFAGILGVASVGITRKSLPVQVLSRGAAWIVAFPALLVIGGSLWQKELPPFSPTAMGLTALTALLLSRPMLHTDEAKAAFDPRVFRRILLAGSTASAATAFLSGGLALIAWLDGSRLAGVGFGAVAAALLAASTAVVRMRAWGILLSAVTALGLLIAALSTGGAAGTALALLTTPMLLLHILPIWLARFKDTPAPAPAAVPMRIADAAAAHVRVGVVDDAELFDEPAFATASLTPERARLAP